MDVRLTWTDCDKAGDYVVPNVLSPRDLVSRPDNMEETVPHTLSGFLHELVFRNWIIGGWLVVWEIGKYTNNSSRITKIRCIFSNRYHKI